MLSRTLSINGNILSKWTEHIFLNNVQRLKVHPNGRVGINTTRFRISLDVNGTSRLTLM